MGMFLMKIGCSTALWVGCACRWKHGSGGEGHSSALLGSFPSCGRRQGRAVGQVSLQCMQFWTTVMCTNFLELG